MYICVCIYKYIYIYIYISGYSRMPTACPLLYVLPLARPPAAKTGNAGIIVGGVVLVVVVIGAQ